METRKFRLIKKYPKSPKEGIIVESYYFTPTGYYYHDPAKKPPSRIYFPDEVEYFPENWEEIL